MTERKDVFTARWEVFISLNDTLCFLCILWQEFQLKKIIIILDYGEKLPRYSDEDAWAKLGVWWLF